MLYFPHFLLRQFSTCIMILPSPRLYRYTRRAWLCPEVYSCLDGHTQRGPARRCTGLSRWFARAVFVTLPSGRLHYSSRRGGRKCSQSHMCQLLSALLSSFIETEIYAAHVDDGNAVAIKNSCLKILLVIFRAALILQMYAIEVEWFDYTVVWILIGNWLIWLQSSWM